MGTKSNLLTGGQNSKVGIGKSYKVYPGDKVKITAYAKYEAGGSTTPQTFGAALLEAFDLDAPAPGEFGTPSAALNSWGTLVAGGSQPGNGSAPLAFVNIIVFDEQYKFLDAAWDQIASTAAQVGVSPDVPHDQMTIEYTVKEEGYVYAYCSNNSASNVYFDDVTVTFTPTNIIQYNACPSEPCRRREYYPFGLQTATSWTRDGSDNDYLYNAGSELNGTTGWYETMFRGYNPSLGRFMQIDPLAIIGRGESPFAYASNNPVLWNDPLGLMTQKQFERMIEEMWNNTPADGYSTWTAGGGSGGGTYRYYSGDW